MKKILILMIFSAFIFSEYSCKKAIEDAIDCTSESIFVVIHADLDTANFKLMHFEFDYNPSEGFYLELPISWNFGDGETINGSEKIDHVYAAGTYEAVASYTLKKGSSSCSSTSSKHIVIH